MIKVDGNLSIDTYNDNSGAVMTFSPEGTVIEQTIATTTTEEPSISTRDKSHILLNQNKGIKANLFRVIIALQKTGFFVDKSGRRATQKDVFNAFGSMLSEDFSTYQKNLYLAGKHNNDSDVSTQIFDELKEAYQEYEDKNNQ